MKRDASDAFEQHVQRAVFQHSVTAFTQPWERGPVMGKGPRLPSFPSIKGRPGTAGPSRPDDTGSKPEEGDSSAFLGSAFKLAKKAGPSWDAKSSAHRSAALAKWSSMVGPYAVHFSFGRQMQADAAEGRQNSLASVLEDIFAGKSTSTLHTRAGPVARYMSFCKSQTVPPFPITESSAYHYMQVTGEKCAATHLRSFVGTLAFLKHVMGAFLDDDVFSPRITGLAAKHYMTKRKLQQKPPLHAKHVFALEEIVCGKVANYSAADKVAAGFFLFAIYARARHSDAQNSSILEEDLCEDEDGDVTGYLEARIERSKTSTTLERKTRWLPMVATIHGISDQCWDLEWMKVLAENGPPLGAGRPLLPGPMENGQWQNVPLSPEASARWLRGLLYRHPADFPNNEIRELGTHSLKATLLSWSSKYGLSLQTRAILGYHSKSKGSVLVYGRDNISQPLRELDEVIRVVAFKRFFPDSLRSGYFKRPKDDVEQPAEPLSDSSSEDSQDEERPDHRDEEEALQLLDPWEPFEGARELVSGMLAFRHHNSRIIHFCDSLEEGSHLECGRAVTTSFFKLDVLPRMLHPVCKQCLPVPQS